MSLHRIKTDTENNARFAAILVALLVIICSGPPSASASTGKLIVFIQTAGSAVDDIFMQTHFPAIQNMTHEMGVQIVVHDVSLGVPESVTITPLMVFQNHRGRSVYQGRTTTPRRIQNFIRTSRFVPQGQTANQLAQIPIRKMNHTQVWAPVKVSPLTGHQPEGYNNDIFIREAINSITDGFQEFRFQPQVSLGRSDRGFYMDFYPWRAEDGTLFLSLALYSQFHCKTPVFEKKHPPLTGPWNKRQVLFHEAAQILEKAVVERIANPLGGDGFAPSDKKIPIKNWEALEYSLPPTPVNAKQTAPLNIDIPQKWTLAPEDPLAPPMIQFRFPAPLDQYAGEVKAATGALHLDKTLVLKGASGFVAVDTRKAVTMGEAMLDEAIGGSLMLHSRKYPEARFTIDAFAGDGKPIAFGHLTPAILTGQFSLKGQSKILTRPAEVEPVLSAAGQPILLVRTSFDIDLREFEIEGAQGPSPQRFKINFDINLRFKKMGL